MLQDASSDEAATALDGPVPVMDVGPIKPGEAGNEDATTDVFLDGTPDGHDGEGGADGPVTDGPTASDGSVDVTDATSPDADANPCNEAGASRTLQKSARTGRPAPPGFVAPASGEQIECTATKPCPPTMMCIGGGCDDVWQCYAHADGEHPCPTDYEPYCGCDGVTFMAIRTCPDRPYERVGACEDGVSCDPTRLLCSVPEPPCPQGQVRSVVDGRYAACVPHHYCQCEFVWECPQREKYKCDVTTRRCAALPTDP
jgi:hypothetical protein